MRIWFNHWFSTAYDLIELIKKDEKDVEIIGSNKRVNSIIRLVCDEWYQEPESNENYIEYCLNFCEEHKIDIFIPRRNLELISKNLSLFSGKGVKVLVDDYSKIELLNDKQKTYELLKDIKELHIPKYYIVENLSEFDKAYKDLSQNSSSVCVKFVKDEGALSYRRIVDGKLTYNRLRVYPGAEVYLDDYRRCLAEKEKFDKLMVMEYLPENEISVDCLSTKQGNIIIPRYKTSGRDETIIFDKYVSDVCERIMIKIGLYYPCNIQFKCKNGIPYLLEINTRMSGGLQMSCLATGLNIPKMAIDKLFGKDFSWQLDDLSKKTVSYIEIPKII